MKRRKKLWIACAALGVVVALCAFALLYRPVPYKFLDGASLVGVSNKSTYLSLSSTTALAPPMKELTTYRYAFEGSFESVTAIARKELTAQDHWRWSGGDDGLMLATAWNGVEERSVAIYDSGKTPGTENPRVHVTVTKPTSPLDRVLAWMHNR